MKQNYIRIADEDLQAWWICAREKLKDRFSDCIKRLDGVVKQARCVVFVADLGKTWFMFSPSDKGLYIEFMWTEKAGMIKRCMPLVYEIMKNGGYKKVFGEAHSKVHEKLYQRYFKANGTSYYLSEGDLRG